MPTRWLLPLLLLFPAVAGAQVTKSSFGMPSRLTIERDVVENVAIGDVDGDGRADLAVTDHVGHWDDHRLRLYFQNLDGSLAPPVIVPISSNINDVYSVALVDMDNDGAKEAAIGTIDSINIVRFSATRIPSKVYDSGPVSGCEIIATGDVDGDGKMDIACHSRNQWPNTAVVYFGDGHGGIRNNVQVVTNAGYGSAGIEFKGLAIGDVTGDGHADLVVTAASAPNFYVIPNDGHGGFLPPVAYAHPASASATAYDDGTWAVSVVITDLDGDSVNEVVFANPENEPDGRVNIYRLSGAGALILSRQIPVYSSTTALLVGDVGGDGDKDLILGHWSYGAISVLGDADAGLESQARYELPGFGNDVMYQRRTGSTNGLALGDLNHDGCNDLAAATYSGVTILYGCQPDATTLPVSDFDGDGVSDLYWRQEGGFMFMWMWADGEARCGSGCPPYDATLPWINQAVGDFDGDGSSDVFSRNPETGGTMIMLRALYPRYGANVPDQDWQVVGAGDFDGDDHSDLFWRNKRTGETIIWWAGQTAGMTWEAQVPDLSWQIATIGDFDGDGRSDVFWRNSSTGRNIVWWQGRSARQQETARVPDTQWRMVGAGDFDQDGRDDVVWRNATTGAGIIWYSGNFTTQVALTTITDLDWQIVAVGDYNGDGISDLMWRNKTTGDNVIWRSARSDQQQPVWSLDWFYHLVI